MAQDARADVEQALAEFGLSGLLGPVDPDAPAGRKAMHAPDHIVARVLTAMANEGAKLVGQGVSLRPSDVDLAMILGHHFPRWEGGPMHWADQRGLLLLRRDLLAWAEDAPEFWEMAPLIDDLIAKGQKFSDLNR